MMIPSQDSVEDETKAKIPAKMPIDEQSGGNSNAAYPMSVRRYPLSYYIGAAIEKGRLEGGLKNGQAWHDSHRWANLQLCDVDSELFSRKRINDHAKRFKRRKKIWERKRERKTDR